MKRCRAEGKRYRVAAYGEALHMTAESIDAYIADMQQKGRVAGTLEEYRRNLNHLYTFLPEDKCIRPSTLRQWRESLLEQGYSPRTVNARISAANSYLAFFGRRDLQVMRQLAFADCSPPEMTRTEYLRLLQTARVLGKERQYLLIKLFGCTGLPVQALERVTVETVRAGQTVVGTGKKRQVIRFPDCLQKELLDYAERSGRTSGPLFVTRAGKPLSRTNVADSIRHLCGDARVPEEKGNPRCLRRMYQETQKGIIQNISVLVDQAYTHLIENEQLTIGWAAT